MPIATMLLKGWQMTGPGEPLRPFESPLPPLSDDEVLVRIAGCGVCHTDLGFLDDGVRTRGKTPLVLGHEISGFVEDAGSAFRPLVGSAVVVPAVIPCGHCADCRDGRPNVCTRQVMPGNDRDGGFATYCVVPGRSLAVVPGAGEDFDAPLGRAKGLTLRHLSVVADAVSTAYQAVVRSGLRKGDLAIVVGLGGVGGFAAQIAAEKGAIVVGLDVDGHRRDAAKEGPAPVAFTADPRNLAPKELRKKIVEVGRELGAAESAWKIFECSGNPAGQTTAFGLLGPSAVLSVVGFTMELVSVRLSNLMAFDARAIGNWGCDPALYPEILEKALDGAWEIASHVDLRPMSELPAALEDVRHHRTHGRIVLMPEK
jgi:6-hydroxycyclohex-1-ene-1-carbonyl-CoA dehydrogenase